MVKVTLVYPYFHSRKDTSIFRFPPLGLGYIASALRRSGVETELVDGTFTTLDETVSRVKHLRPQIVGIYSMFSMNKASREVARRLRGHCDLLVAGGPLPSLGPADFLDVFDIAAIGEGERTMVEIAQSFEKKKPISDVKGIAYKDAGRLRISPPRECTNDLDSLAFPSRDLFENELYKRHYRKRFGYTVSPLITSRGCPFSCNFCSRPVFGTTFRTRSPQNIVAEVEEITDLGYDRVWFADDCFTLNPTHLKLVCDLLVQKQIGIEWECLSRVDTLNADLALEMKRAGCARVFFGIESGNDDVLALMNKQITTDQARKAVHAAKKGGLQAGAFFIIGYPGETEQTVLDTIRFASRLPLDYLSFTLPYPIPGTVLFDQVKNNGNFSVDDWEEPKNWGLIQHKLLYNSRFSERKLKFAIVKAQLQFKGRRLLGDRVYNVLVAPFEGLTDVAFRFMP